jgi:hypothetical protein
MSILTMPNYWHVSCKTLMIYGDKDLLKIGIMSQLFVFISESLEKRIIKN